MKNHVYAGTLVASAILSACGGGGSSTASPSTSPVASVTKAEGLYSGTTTGGYTFSALILENDEVWAIYGLPVSGSLSVHGLNWAQGSSKGGSFSATNAKDYYYTGAVTTGTLNASYVAGSSFNGTAVANGMSTGFTSAPPIATNYSYNTAATLSTISGSWSGSTLFTGETGTVTIALNGNITASFKGSYTGTCTGTGTAQPRASGKNVFNISLTFGPAPCGLPGTTATGIAISYLLTDGRRQLITAVTTSNKALGTAFFAAR